MTPVSGSTWQFAVERIDDRTVPDGDRGVYVNLVSPGWFRTFGTPLLAGRDFTDRDTKAGTQVVIVNEAFARTFTERTESGRPPSAAAGVPGQAVGRSGDRRLREGRRLPIAARAGAAHDVRPDRAARRSRRRDLDFACGRPAARRLF